MATMQPPKLLLMRVLKPGTSCTPATILNPDNWVPIYHEPNPLSRNVFEAAKAVAEKKKEAAASKRKATEANTNAAASAAEVQVAVEWNDAIAATKEPVAVVVADYVEVVVVNAEDTAIVQKEDGSVAAKQNDSRAASGADVVVHLAKKDGASVTYTNSQKKNEVVITEEEIYEAEDVQVAVEKNDDIAGTNTETKKAENAVLEDEFYEVEAIVGHRMKKGVLQYEIKWVGYSSMDNTFEPEKNLDGSEELLKAYKKAHNLKS